MKKFKFDTTVFKKWIDMNRLSRSKVINAIGQRDANKVGRWELGQVIGTEDLLALCNCYNLQLTDFLIETDSDDIPTETVLPEVMKQRRKTIDSPSIVEMATQSLTADDLTIARLSLEYEKKINDITSINTEYIKEQTASFQYQRDQLVRQHSSQINSLNGTIDTLQDVINQQKETIATLEALVLKQKNIKQGKPETVNDPLIMPTPKKRERKSTNI